MGIEVICAFNVPAIGVLLVTKEYLYNIFVFFFRKSVDGFQGQALTIFFLFCFSGDTDQVVRDLFGPLVDQLIHWFTRRSAGGGGRSEVRRREAECLLTAILSGLSNDEEGTGIMITRYSNGLCLALKHCFVAE